MPYLRSSLCAAACLAVAADAAPMACPTLHPPTDFNVSDWAVNPKAPQTGDFSWYFHSMMPISYLPEDVFYCVAARYTGGATADKIKVYNYENHDKVGGKVGSTNICGEVRDPSQPAELSVAPCFLPSILGGPYWILHYNATAGLGLISGGQPTDEGPDGCKTGTGENGSGLWIALRTQQRDEGLVARGQALLKGMGFDTGVLRDVVHEGCTYKPK